MVEPTDIPTLCHICGKDFRYSTHVLVTSVGYGADAKEAFRKYLCYDHANQALRDLANPDIVREFLIRHHVDHVWLEELALSPDLVLVYDVIPV